MPTVCSSSNDWPWSVLPHAKRISRHTPCASERPPAAQRIGGCRKEMNFATHFCLSMRVDTLRSSKSSKSSKRSQRERGIYCCVFLYIYCIIRKRVLKVVIFTIYFLLSALLYHGYVPTMRKALSYIESSSSGTKWPGPDLRLGVECARAARSPLTRVWLGLRIFGRREQSQAWRCVKGEKAAFSGRLDAQLTALSLTMAARRCYTVGNE